MLNNNLEKIKVKKFNYFKEISSIKQISENIELIKIIL